MNDYEQARRAQNVGWVGAPMDCASGPGVGARRVGEIERQMSSIDAIIDQANVEIIQLREAIGGVCKRPVPQPAQVNAQTQKGEIEPSTQSDLGDRLLSFRGRLNDIVSNLRSLQESVAL